MTRLNIFGQLTMGHKKKRFVESFYFNLSFNGNTLVNRTDILTVPLPYFSIPKLKYIYDVIPCISN